jgi:ribosomal protein S19
MTKVPDISNAEPKLDESGQAAVRRRRSRTPQAPSRRTRIVPEMVGCAIAVGSSDDPVVVVTDSMVGRRLGEFVPEQGRADLVEFEGPPMSDSDFAGDTPQVGPKYTPNDVVARLANELHELGEQGIIGADETTRELPAIWGPGPSAAERDQAEAANLRKAFLARRAVIAKSISRSEAARLLGLSEQALTKQLELDRLIGLKDRGRWAIPSWQFDADTRDGYLPGVERLAAVFPGGPVALTQWANRPNADFDGASPRDLLALNRVDEVVGAAAALTAKGW